MGTLIFFLYQIFYLGRKFSHLQEYQIPQWILTESPLCFMNIMQSGKVSKGVWYSTFGLPLHETSIYLLFKVSYYFHRRPATQVLTEKNVRITILHTADNESLSMCGY